MKKLILLALVSTFAMSGFINETDNKAVEAAKENARLCEIFKEKVQTYESTMRNDGLAEATLISYKKRMSSYCDASSVKSDEVKVETEKTVETAKAEIKTSDKAEENARLCNVFTDKVQTYEPTMRNDDLAKATLASYKKRMSTFCAVSSVRS
ncbi:MAG: hypothetical protein OQK45_01075 [Sulfurovum sp.]|nr:hypothetical protein [Sulfurovum sp.]